MVPTSDEAGSFVNGPVTALPTPCLTLDLPLLERNLATLQADVSAAGKALRAHAKSHKCTRLARLQQERGAIGICAAKLSEAERLVAAGITGVLVTGPIVSRQAHERLICCWRQGGDLTITLDSESNAIAISRALEAAGEVTRPLPFLLDLDVGQARTGVSLENAVALAGRLARLPHLKMVGVQAYAGHVQHLLSREERCRVNAECMEKARAVFEALKGGDVQLLSVGGTGSYEFDLEIPEVTEVQAGSYVLMDADYLAVEAASGTGWRFDAALKLRTTVMSTQQRGFVTLDAGLKSVYHDGPAPLVVQPEGGTLVYDWFGDEYGRLSGAEEETARLKEGDQVSLIVSHCDPTVNLFDFYYVVNGETVVDLWPIDLRGCSH